MKKTIFIHIPKNGGMTIRDRRSKIYKDIIIGNPENLIDKKYCDILKKTMNEKGFKDPGYQHARWRDFNDELTKKFKSFAVIRNPWSRTVSRYTFGQIAGVFGKDYTFNNFIERRHEFKNMHFFWHRAVDGWYQQLDYITNEQGVIKCDILRFEHFNDDIQKYFNLSEPLDVHNLSNGVRENNNKDVKVKKDYRDFYSQDTKEIVAELYKKDIETFGFTFNGTATKNIWNNK